MANHFFKNYTFQKDPDEEIIFKVRKHWLILFFSFFKAFISLIILFIILYLIGFSLVVFYLALSIIFGIWFIVTIVYAFYEWAIWYLDLYVLTDKRIIDIEQKTLFSRQVSESSLERIQDVTFETRGFFATFFNYGNIKVETAGKETVISLDQVSEPDKLQKIIVNQSSEQENKEEENKDEEMFIKKSFKG
jgi:uncharacterized membrane protein YdbT with pleckstrin-like domain